jgi:hypothetical protein
MSKTKNVYVFTARYKMKHKIREDGRENFTVIYIKQSPTLGIYYFYLKENVKQVNEI